MLISSLAKFGAPRFIFFSILLRYEMITKIKITIIIKKKKKKQFSVIPQSFNSRVNHTLKKFFNVTI